MNRMCALDSKAIHTIAAMPHIGPKMSVWCWWWSETWGIPSICRIIWNQECLSQSLFQLINEMFLFLLHWKIELLMVLGSLDEHQRHYDLSSSRTLNINIMEKPSDVKTFQPDECSMFRLHTNTSVTVDTALRVSHYKVINLTDI